MSKILFVNACIRPNSRTLELAKHVLSSLTGSVEEIKLYEEKLYPLTLKEMEIRDKSAQKKDFSNDIFNLPKQFVYFHSRKNILPARHIGKRMDF